MARLPTAAVATAIVCGIVFGPSVALAHGGAMSAGFGRGGFVVRPIGLRPSPIRRAFLHHRFHFNPARGEAGVGSAGGTVFGPLYAVPTEPASDGDGFYQPPPPAWRECISETRMVPATTHRGLTPVSITRCWRRN
jgi:hypothetical protein